MKSITAGVEGATNCPACFVFKLGCHNSGPELDIFDPLDGRVVNRKMGQASCSKEVGQRWFFDYFPRSSIKHVQCQRYQAFNVLLLIIIACEIEANCWEFRAI